MAQMIDVRCIICGVGIQREGDWGDSWLQSYRMIYRTSEGAHISDIGRRRQEGDEEIFRIPVLNRDRNSAGVSWICIPILQERDGRFGFVSHNACWTLLQRRAQPYQIPLHRLMEVFESVPKNRGNTRICYYSWAHKYGEVIEFDSQRWPWEDRGRNSDLGPIAGIGTLYDGSPFASGMEEILKSTTLTGPSVFDIFAVKLQGWSGSDCFANLPLEIVEEIVSYLPTSTVLKLRLVSRAFTQLFYNQMFWASRFRPTGEMGFLFEAWEERALRDWRLLYKRTRNITVTYPGLRNRLRIWYLADILLEKLTLTRADMSTHLAIGHRLSSFRRGEVYGDLVVGRRFKKKWSRQEIVPERTEVPPHVHRIGVSIIKDGVTAYIAGIQIYYGATEKVIRLGYITAPGTTVCIETASLKGFTLSVGSSGIHALQVVQGENRTSSPWIGHPGNGAKTRRLVFSEQFVALSAGFDGYKMVYLSAWGKRKGIPMTSKELDLIKNNLLWFPELPSPGEYLNVTSAFGRWGQSTRGFRPVIRTSFGGRRGVDLRSLTGVSATIGRDRLVNIGFHYNYDVTPGGQRLLSQRRVGINILSFKLHGPEGEFIKAVEVGKSGNKITGLKVCQVISLPYKTLTSPDNNKLGKVVHTYRQLAWK
ncbi:F-box protein [Aspergillus lucknowensis]|uniref:F-box domain-containing protein n=1 Tax=Aspergillus lucknowensis TaxID=176173 RepID=A0ABR4LZC0_9EURO